MSAQSGLILRTGLSWSHQAKSLLQMLVSGEFVNLVHIGFCLKIENNDVINDSFIKKLNKIFVNDTETPQ